MAAFGSPLPLRKRPTFRSCVATARKRERNPKQTQLPKRRVELIGCSLPNPSSAKSLLKLQDDAPGPCLFALAGTGLLAPSNRLQCFEVILRQFNWPLAPAPSPAIAFNAADKTLTVVVDFDQRLITLVAAARWHGHGRFEIGLWFWSEGSSARLCYRLRLP
jgi:hypothetical protein